MKHNCSSVRAQNEGQSINPLKLTPIHVCTSLGGKDSVSFCWDATFFHPRMRKSLIIFSGLFSSLCSVQKPVYVSIRLNYSAHALVAVDSKSPESETALLETETSPIELQEDRQKVPNEFVYNNLKTSSYSSKLGRSDVTERVEKNVVMLGKEEIAFSERNERLRRYSGLLHFCASKGFLNEGKAVHGQVIKNGIHADSFMWNSLVNVYAKCGSYLYARQVLDEMPEPDVVSWTALITGFVADGYSRDGTSMFCEMRKEGIRPNGFTLATCLKACSMCLDSDLGKQLHAEITKIGLFSDVIVGSALIDLYAKCGEMELADTVFFCMPTRNVVSWNSMLNGWAQLGNGKEVLKLYSNLVEPEMKFSVFTFSTVLKGCANSGYSRDAQAVHCLAIKVGCELHEYVSCSLLDMYSKCGLADDALKAFEGIKDPNVVAWSAMIYCLDQQGQSREVAELFCSMQCAGVRPNQFTLSSLVSTATNLGDRQYGESIHSCIFKYGYESDSFISNALVTLYMKIGSVKKSCQVFEAISQHDTASWNAILSGFYGNGTCDQGPIFFYRMLMEGFKPDIFTFVGILGCCSNLSDICFGKQVQTHIVKNGLDGNSIIGTALIDMFAKSRCLEDADAVFSRLQERDVFAWTAIIGNYALTNQGEKVFKCFTQMQQENVKFNEFTLSICVSGCSSLATLENGRQLHSLAIKTGMSGDTYVASALVDMYSKCRCIEDAEAAFKEMVERNTVSWNAIICGYSQHGKGEKALEAFKLMLDEGAVPDEVTFIGVLSACSHLGLVEEGKKHFNSLSKVYGITPAIEHHACMVNILCRAGKFCEVESYIEEMELTQNALIWEAVLWASIMHENVKFAQKAAEKLFALDRKMNYNYILLSDIFAAKGRWVDVAKVRALMCSQGIKKEPSCSCVEIDAQTHMFFAQDGSQPKVRDICKQLGGLIS